MRPPSLREGDRGGAPGFEGETNQINTKRKRIVLQAHKTILNSEFATAPRQRNIREYSDRVLNHTDPIAGARFSRVRLRLGIFAFIHRPK